VKAKRVQKGKKPRLPIHGDESDISDVGEDDEPRLPLPKVSMPENESDISEEGETPKPTSTIARPGPHTPRCLQSRSRPSGGRPGNITLREHTNMTLPHPTETIVVIAMYPGPAATPNEPRSQKKSVNKTPVGMRLSPRNRNFPHQQSAQRLNLLRKWWL